MIWRRKQSLVNPRQQVWLALEWLFVVIGFCSLCLMLLFMPLPIISNLFSSDLDSSWVLENFLKVVYAKWPLVIVSCLVLIAFGILMSHRLAGPIFGLTQVLKEWSKGNFAARVRFRKYDYLLPLRTPLNDHFDRLEQMHSRLNVIADELEKNPPAEKLQSFAKELKSFSAKRSE